MVGVKSKMSNWNVAWKTSVVLANFNVALWNSDVESQTTNIECELNIESESRILAGV